MSFHERSTHLRRFLSRLCFGAIAVIGCSSEVSDSFEDPTVETYPFSFDDYMVPAQATSYMCRGFSIELKGERQIVAFDPVIDDYTVVHRMVLYEVAAPPPSEPFSCLDMPRGAVPRYGWAPGTGSIELPEDVGLPIGQVSDRAHFVLQIHYDNPRAAAGHLDSSGVLVHATDELRPNEAGVLTLGMVDSIEIPPNQSSHHQSDACDTRSFGSSINVFGSILHGHLLTRRIWTEQIRAGSSVGDVGRNDHFDFDLQRFVPLETRVDPGDILVTHCVWNSTGRETWTRGGEGSRDEMCLNSIFYYPRLGTAYCGGG